MIRNLFATADSRTVSIAFASISLSLVITLPTIVSVTRWIGSSLRLKLLLLRNTSDGAHNKGDVSVSGIFVHPVKSMRSISLSESTLDQKGLTHDRRFMVVYELPHPAHRKERGPNDTTHQFLTQRQCPSLATISATITTADNNGEQKILVLEQKIDGDKVSSAIRVPLTNLSNPLKKTHLARIWDDVVAVEDMGEDAAAFLQSIADADDEFSVSGPEDKKIVRLVTASPIALDYGRDDRSYVPGYAKTLTGGYLGKPTLTDGFPILIASESSLEALNQKLREAGKEAIHMSRFRPNIVVKGSSLKPFEEDRWKLIAIGDTIFSIVKACPRCKQSCTDQINGKVSREMEPLKTMMSFRRASLDKPEKGAVFFAQNAIPIGRLEGKTIKIGDNVQILETGDPVFIG